MLISGLFILLFISAIAGQRFNGIIINRAAALVLLYSFIISIYTLNVSIIGSGIGVTGGLYQITVLSKIVELVIYLIGGIILANRIEIKNVEFLNIKSEYALLALFTIIGGILLITSNDLISMYMAIELQSFGLYVLATIYRDSQSATSAGLKYFLLGGLSSCFILLGSGIIYSNLAVTNLESISLLLADNLTTSSTINNSLFFNDCELGLVILLTGFLFKIASAPFHNWAPDVYDGVPTKVTIWLAVMGKISILTFILNIVVEVNKNNSESLSQSSLSLINIILIASLLSLIIGTVVGLAQTRIKRLLAYSTISHVGFLLLAIGINKVDSIESFIFYIIQYSLTSANAFFIIIAIGTITVAKNHINNKSYDNLDLDKEYSPIEFISQLKGQFFKEQPLPLLALALTIVLFSMAGIPPLIGFFAKQTVLLSAIKNGYVFLAIIGIITSVISAGYYLRIIKVMFFSSDKTSSNAFINEIAINNEELNTEKGQKAAEIKEIRLSNSMSFTISLLTILIILFVFKPTLILNNAHIMALTIFYI